MGRFSKAFWRGFGSILELCPPRRRNRIKMPTGNQLSDLKNITEDFNKAMATISSQTNFRFCETEAATAISPWHIRMLTERGRNLSGGADTVSLCKTKVAWDLDVDITEHHLTHCCHDCARIYRELGGQT